MPRCDALLGCLILGAASNWAEGQSPQWKTHADHRRAAMPIGPGARVGFTELSAPNAGITFTNRLAQERSITNQILLNGSGVAMGDVDGDGWTDLYLCGLDSPNALYRNLGNWKFEDRTAASGVACADQSSTGAVLVDVDGDGDLDLLVNGIGRGTRLFLNDGTGRYNETTDEAGLRNTRGSTSFAVADVDGDGWLDLYVVNYRNDTMRDMPDIRFRFGVTNGVSQLLAVNGRPPTAPDLIGRFTFDETSGVLENGEADVLYRNMGKGHFRPVEWIGGAFRDETGQPVDTPYDWGLSAMFHDMNGDGAPDLYVCNDFQSPDRIWINDGKGGFQAIARDAFRHTSLFSMGVDFADLDRDGHDDLFVADMLGRQHAARQVQVMDATAFAQYRNSAGSRPQYPRNTLFRNRGDGTFTELASLAGVEASDWTWCPVFLDVDLDGFEDLLLTTGHERDAQNADVARELEELRSRQALSPKDQLRLRRRFPRLDTPNAAFRNRGDWIFEDMSHAWGFESRRISQGIAMADLDNDGDLDVVINCLNDAPLLCRNDAFRPRIAVRLRGSAPNTRGIGARIRVLAPGLPPQEKEMMAGGRYLSGDDSICTFAARSDGAVTTVEVTWRSGRRSRISQVPANQLYELDESLATNPPTAAPLAAPRPFFEDVSALIAHRHVDEPFDDFARQPLLPHRLTELGPGVSWFDFNGDGWEDLMIGAGRGGTPGVFRNDGKGGFVRQRAKIFETPIERDLTSLLGWRPATNELVLLMGLAQDEETGANAPALREVSLTTGKVTDHGAIAPGSSGPLALADVDRDGDLDVFMGGRFRAGRYPEPVPSLLLESIDGHLHPALEASRALSEVGLVSGALFTDLDGDAWPELVVACDWGPLRIFRNERGRLRPWDPEVAKMENARPSPAGRLSAWTGWWNGVTAADFDGDGRMDLAVGNEGWNTDRNQFLSQPLRLYFGEADASGRLALLEAHYDSGASAYVPARDWGTLGGTFPSILARFPGFTAFSRAKLDEVLAAGLPPMRHLTAAVMESVVLLNRGERFEIRPLPIEAQLSPVFGIASADLDGDGKEDLFITQNRFGVSPVESRQDAGCGAWLRGDGRGGFVAVPPNESGIRIHGEGRGLALGDFDHDGRIDAAAGQHGGMTKLYRNAKARPGLRIHLEGPPGNPAAIGATLNLVFVDGHRGPAREIRAGGGYWSQDASDVILASPVEPTSLEIHWPDGSRESVPWKGGGNVLSRAWAKEPTN